MGHATDKQMRYCDVLADQLGLRDGWDLISDATGMSRSKAQRSAGFREVSAAIDWAKERLEKRARRADAAEGAVDDGSVLLGGQWCKLTPDALARYEAARPLLDAAKIARLSARRAELKADRHARPFGAALDEVLVIDPRAELRAERERLILRIAEIEVELTECDGSRAGCTGQTGMPGVRDTKNLCDMFRPGKPTNGGCQGDGHYLCRECGLFDNRGEP
jgi:hypothetical protein